MKTIYKFEFAVQDKAVVNMPIGASVIAVGSQNPTQICVWAIVDSLAVYVYAQRTFHVRGTGHSLDGIDTDKYHGMVQDGPFVWHVFGD